MQAAFDESGLREALQTRLLEGPSGIGRLGVLIDVANLHHALLHIPKYESIRFRPDPVATRPLKPPTFDRLVLVLPESHEVNWIISVSGYFEIAYNSTIKPVPRLIESFRIRYTAVLVPHEGQLVFKNERVMLI